MEQEKLKLTSTSSFPEIEDSEGEDSLLEDDVLCDQVENDAPQVFIPITNRKCQCCGAVFRSALAWAPTLGVKVAFRFFPIYVS